MADFTQEQINAINSAIRSSGSPLPLVDDGSVLKLDETTVEVNVVN